MCIFCRDDGPGDGPDSGPECARCGAELGAEPDDVFEVPAEPAGPLELGGRARATVETRVCPACDYVTFTEIPRSAPAGSASQESAGRAGDDRGARGPRGERA